MPTAPGCSSRRERLREALPQACDLLIVGDRRHLISFADDAQSPPVSRSADAGAMLVPEPGKSTLVGDHLVGPFLDRAHVDEVVAPTRYEGKRSAPSRWGRPLITDEGYEPPTAHAIRVAP